MPAAGAMPPPEPERAQAAPPPRLSLPSLAERADELSEALQQHSFVILHDLPQSDLDTVLSTPLRPRCSAAEPPLRARRSSA